MSQLADYSVLITAFFAGILGSGHCFGMCGGIATGLGRLGGSVQQESRVQSALLFNLGRLLSYAMLGFLSAWVLVRTGQVLLVPGWGIVLRLLTALMIFLIGLQLLFDLKLLALIEKAGAGLWRLIQPLALSAAKLPGGGGRLLLGLSWGFLPCGLVYSILLMAAASGSALTGALVMVAFGLGTLPSMLGMSLAAPSLTAFLSDRWTRKLMGVAMLVLAVLSVSLLLINPQLHQNIHSGG